jgi:hypothetical protein
VCTEKREEKRKEKRREKRISIETTKYKNFDID